MAQRGRTQRRRAPSSALAKITPPSLSGIHPRTRLFRLLDQTRRKHPVVWLSAAAGAGKTTLIASYAQARRLSALWYQVDSGDNDVASFFYYLGSATKAAAPRYRRPMPFLTREYLGGLPTFATNYFRELFARLKPPAVVVFDNYQELAADSPVQDVLERGFVEIPNGINVIVVSREDPPPTFARLRACGKIGSLGWDELKLTAEESARIVKLRARRATFMPEAIRHLYRKTQGWVAGLVLLTEQAERRIAPQGEPQAFAGEEVFDYFAAEIFRHADPAVRVFFLKTAFLPRVQLSVAETLTREPSAAAMLNYLTRRNLFTVRHADGSYEYHPLFRDFLAARASEEFSAVELQQIKRDSARLLAETGDIENSVALLLRAPADWDEALARILEHAGVLVETGRTRTLETWLRAFPESRRAANPWMLYWLGMCRLAFAPAEARTHFERAFALFEKGSDASPLYLTWSGIIESFVLERDDFTPMRPWLERYHALAEGRTPPGRDVEATSRVTYVLGLVSTAFDHPDLPVEANRVAQRLARQSQEWRWFMGLVTLIPYYVWRGELIEMRAALDQLGGYARSPDARPLAQLSWYTWRCLYEGSTGATEVALQLAKDGLALAERTGVHVFDSQLLGYCIWGQLCAGNVGAARELLQQLRPLVSGRRVGDAYYSHYASLISLHEGDIDAAVAQGRRSAEQARASGLSLGEMSYLLGLAYVLATRGDLDEAAAVLADSRTKAVAMSSKVYMAFVAFGEAYIHSRRGAQEPMLAALRQSLALLREIGVVIPAYLPRADAAGLCAVALEHGIEVEYVRNTIFRTRLAPPAGSYPEQWPWPVRIYSLGRFAVYKHSARVAFSSKAQRKPFALLRALIAYGGRAVPVGKLLESLWPDTDGDVARTTFRSTLHRLRRLIGDRAVVMEDGMLSLAPGHCWLDTWAVEALLGREADPRSAGARLLALYRGAFLEEEESAWSLIPRERLRAKFVQAVIRYGEALSRSDAWEAAAELYSQALDRDPLAEPFYRALMQCYRQLHRSADALAVYRRCRNTLKKVLHVDPSPETEALRRAIVEGY